MDLVTYGAVVVESAASRAAEAAFDVGDEEARFVEARGMGVRLSQRDVGL